MTSFLWTTNHTFPAFTLLLYLPAVAGTALIVLASCRASLLLAVIHAREVARVALEMESHLPGVNREDDAHRPRACGVECAGREKRRHVGTQPRTCVHSKVHVRGRLEGARAALHSGPDGRTD